MSAEMAEQQRRLVEELKSAQSILRRRRAQAAASETGQQHQLQNGGIHVSKPNAPSIDAPCMTKKPRSEPDAAAPDAIHVCSEF